MSIKKSNEQIYGRNNQVMLEMHDKIYGSLGISEQYVLNTVKGNPVVLSNPKSGKLNDVVTEFQMQGWTEQAQYEGKNLFDISDFETNNKGIIENGTILFKQSLGTVTYYLSLSPGTYSISIKRSGYSGINIKVNEVLVVNNGGSNNLTSNFDVSDGDSVVLEFSEGQNPNGEDRMIYDIMLNSGSIALPYEPYTGGQPSPNPDYPQEIVSAGKYDEGTGKYQYEINVSDAEENPTKSQTVTLTADRPLTKWDRLEKRSGVWGWVYKTKTINLSTVKMWSVADDGHTDYAVVRFYTYIADVFPNGECMSERLIEYAPGNISKFKTANFECMNISNTRYLQIKFNRAVASTSDAFNQYLQENVINVNYKSTEETFIPLSESEQEQMNELEIYIPTTVISNNVMSQMKITYKATQSLEV